MTNHKATFLVQARRSAWPRVFGVMLSCAVAALALDSATAAFARMGENAATTKLELTPEDDTVQHFCKLGDACGDDSALTGNFRGIWRNAKFVEPNPKSFPGIRFIGKVLSVVESGNAFDVYCFTQDGNEACAKITAGGSGADGLCHGIIDVQHNADCPAEFDYKLEYDKETTTVLKTCQPDVVATCLADDSALVTNGQILAHSALFDYDCRRSCGGACCTN